MHGECWKLTEREENPLFVKVSELKGTEKLSANNVLGQRLITYYVCHLTGFHNPLIPPLILSAFIWESC